MDFSLAYPTEEDEIFTHWTSDVNSDFTNVGFDLQRNTGSQVPGGFYLGEGDTWKSEIRCARKLEYVLQKGARVLYLTRLTCQRTFFPPADRETAFKQLLANGVDVIESEFRGERELAVINGKVLRLHSDMLQP